MRPFRDLATAIQQLVDAAIVAADLGEGLVAAVLVRLLQPADVVLHNVRHDLPRRLEGAWISRHCCSNEARSVPKCRVNPLLPDDV